MSLWLPRILKQLIQHTFLGKRNVWSGVSSVACHSGSVVGYLSYSARQEVSSSQSASCRQDLKKNADGIQVAIATRKIGNTETAVSHVESLSGERLVRG